MSGKLVSTAKKKALLGLDPSMNLDSNKTVPTQVSEMPDLI